MKMTIKSVGLVLLGMAVLSGCGTRENAKQYDGKKLLEQKCAQCHNLDMPPKTYADEKAPPMMAVVFHVRDFMKVANPSDKKDRFIAFVQDYVIHPDRSKSFCDKKSLQTYGLMPSQKGRVTRDQLAAIAAYMYDHYDPQKYMAIMTEKARLEALPPYKRVLAQKNCLGCHGLKKDKVAPAFTRIAEHYADNPKAVEEAITRGSRGHWKGFKLAMPPFKDLTPEELKGITDWVLSQAKR